MAEYHVTSPKQLFFEVFNGQQLIGKLTYKSWFKFDATIEMPEQPVYLVEPKGFWGTTILVKEGDNVRLKFAMNWSGHIVIQTFFNSVEQGYVFKQRGFFKESFILSDEQGVELLAMKPKMKWNTMSYEYQVDTTDVFERLPKKDLLLMNTVHCANFYMSMMMASVTPGG